MILLWISLFKYMFGSISRETVIDFEGLGLILTCLIVFE